MSKNISYRLAVVAVVALLAAGCAKPPQVEIDATKAALTAAETAEAKTYATDAWNTAQQSLNAANAEVEAQNAKFALFRSYTKAKELLAKAKMDAEMAQREGVAGKEKARNEAQAAVDAVKASLTNAETLLTDLAACKRKPKGFAKDLEQLQGSLQGLKDVLPGIESAFAQEDFFGAKSQAQSLDQQVGTLVTDLTNAKTKINC